MLIDVKKVYAECDLADVQFFFDDLFETKKFSKCGTFEQVLRQLRRGHLDTFNITCLEQLATRFQRDDMDKLIQLYQNQKEEFLKDTKVLEFHEAVASHGKVEPVVPGERTTVTIKIPKSMAGRRTLKDMEILAEKAFGDYYTSFVSLNVVPGSIIVTWIFPEKLVAELKRMAHANAAVFTQAVVEEVTVAGTVVFLYSFDEVSTEIHVGSLN